ncbi:conjugal transfer protein TraF [Alteromonas gilva]|uniref:Conjugal transfer protein TraF n=1 Tax=Alteromonas gilva TaxID=2987522 RepID=A0ABT5L737_9ALTE|nr:conjugal transfer protein TraF [Alteromonas gilva]MDC8832860.1 conjugal transfer protein TraF [Alteromonas gilva]
MRYSLLLLALLPLLSSGEPESKNFYSDRERGWFWFEVEPEPTEEDEAIPESSTQSNKSVKSEPKNITLDIEWLRNNIDRLRDTAIETPSKENLASFAYAQRLMLDYSTRFSTKMMEFIETEPALDENQRRPTTTVGLSMFRDQTKRGISEALTAVIQNAHIWFFYRSDCGFCHKQLPILQELQHRHGVKILAVSMDGKQIPGMEGFQHVNDYGLKVSKRLKVVATPTMFLVGNNKEFFYPLTRGLEALPKIEDRLILAARETKLIDEQQYAKAQSVREINVFENKKGNIVVDKEQLEKDPGYLADVLRAKLLGQTSPLNESE